MLILPLNCIIEVCPNECRYLQKSEDSIGSLVDKVTGSDEQSDVGTKDERLVLVQDQFYP